MSDHTFNHWQLPSWVGRLQRQLQPMVLVRHIYQAIHWLGLALIFFILLPYRLAYRVNWRQLRSQVTRATQITIHFIRTNLLPVCFRITRRLVKWIYFFTTNPRRILPTLEAATHDFRLSIRYLIKHPSKTPQYVTYLVHQVSPATWAGMGLATVGLIIGLFLPSLIGKYSSYAPQREPEFTRSWFSGYQVEATSFQGNITTKLGTTSDGLKLRVERGEYSLDFEMPILNADLNVEKGKASYQNDQQRIKIEYQLVGNGIKESIILASDPGINEFNSTINSNGLIPYVTPEQQIVFYNQAGEYQFHFETPFAFDAVGNTTYGVKYKIEPIEDTDDSLVNPMGAAPADNPYAIPSMNTLAQTLLGEKKALTMSISSTHQYTLTTLVNPKWLSDPTRVYPITIDPTIVHDTSAEFATGQLNRVKDIGSGSFPKLETYYQELPADESTILLLHMNEGSANTCTGGVNDICDSSGNSLDGALGGDQVGYTTGRVDYGLEIFGSDDYIDVADNDKLSQWQNGFSMEGWFKADTINTSNVTTLMGKGTTSNWEYVLYLNTSTGAPMCVTYTSAGTAIYQATATSVPSTGDWHHIACTFDTNGMVVYMDGVEIARDSVPAVTTAMANGTAGFRIGMRTDNSGNEFDGVVDEIRLSNRVRTTEEIRLAASRRPYSVYTSEAIDLTTAASYDDFYWDERGVATGDGETASSSASLIAQWNFNETSGTTAAQSAGTCGATCNLTLTNFDSTSSQDADPDSGWTANNKRWGAGALEFDGTDSYTTCTDANCGGTSKLDPGTSDFSYGAWFKTSNGSGTQNIISKGTCSSSTDCYYVRVLNGSLHVMIADGTNERQKTLHRVDDGLWHFVTVVVDSNYLRTYLDGKLLDASDASTIGDIDTASSFHIGAVSGPSAYFHGTIDTAFFYQRALPYHEILSNYNTGTIEFQTRSSANGSTWEAWKPTTSETAVESFDTEMTDVDTLTDSWRKYNTTTPSNSDTTGTNGQIPLGTNGTGDDRYAYHPNVILDGGTYKMWYSGEDGATSRIYYATSSDGLTWTKVNNAIPSNSDTTSSDGRIPLGTGGTGDDAHTFDGAVIKDGSTYKMWYSGQDGTNWRIYYATSSDGLVWTKYNNAVPSNSDTTSSDGRVPLGTNGTGDDADVYGPSVIKDGSTYRMWYVGSDGANTRIYYATSSDGLTWTKVNNAVPSNSDFLSTGGRIPLGSSNTGDDANVQYASVILHNNVYKMSYAGYNGSSWRIYSAISADGSTWKKINNAESTISDTSSTQGRVPLGSNTTGDDALTLSGSTLVNGDNITLWYNGYDGTNYRIYRADMATMTPIQSTIEADLIHEGDYSNKLVTGQLKADAHTVALWHFEETNSDNGGVDIFDATANNNDGEFNGSTIATGVVDGIKGKARNFTSASSDYIEVTDHASLDITGYGTLEAWVKPANISGNDMVLGKPTGGNLQNHNYALYLTSGVPVGVLGNGASSNTVSGATAIRANEWNHIAFVWNGSNLIMYINGVQSASAAQTITPAANAANINIGRWTGFSTYDYDGVYDEIRISNTARTALEIAESFRMGRDHTLTKTLSSTDLSGKTHLPVYVAADRPGTYLNANISESAYAAYKPDSSTVAQWHMDEDVLAWGDTFTGSTINTAKWVEVDTSCNKVTQSNGITFAYSGGFGCAAAWDGAIISNKTFPRNGGLQLNARVRIGASIAAGNHMMIGFATNQTSSASYTNINHALYFDAGTFDIYQDGANPANNLGSGFTTNTDYDIRITLYPTGPAMYEVKGGVYTDWTILYVADSAKSNTPVRIHAVTYQSTFMIKSVSVSHLDTPLEDSSSTFSNTQNLAHSILTEGVIGKARYFDGASVIRIPETTATDLGALTDNFTLETWFNTTTAMSAAGILVGKNDGSGAYSMMYMDTNESICMRIVAGVTTDACSAIGLNDGKWHHAVGVRDVANDRILIYIDGMLHTSTTDGSTDSTAQNNDDWTIGNGGNFYTGNPFTGWLDEVRISNVARTATEIRQAAEYGKRTHPITIDFAAELETDGTICDGDPSNTVTVDATVYGLQNKGSGLYIGDKLIIREVVNDIEYVTQGDVTAVNISTGSINISWDGASANAPSSCYGVNAHVFKWQREYIDLTGLTDDQINAVTNLTFRVTNGLEGRTIWVDDMKSTGGYLSTPTTNTLTSTAQRYFQYRAIISSSDPFVSPWFEDVTLSYTSNVPPNTPTLDSPTDTATGVSRTPTLRTTTTDTNSDYLRYKIELCTNVGMSTGCQTFDQTLSQGGWSGQNAQTSTAYNSGTQGVYTISSALTANTTYYWRSYAIDPGGINTWSGTQGSPYSFTTSQTPTAPTTLWTEGGANPSSVTDLTPEFSAIYTDPDTSETATYYRIQVSPTNYFTGPLVWDSGQTSISAITQGNRSSDISYAGTALTHDGTTYYWRIKFWDAGGNEGTYSTETASFTMSSLPGPTACTLDEHPNNGSITVNWTDSSNIESNYEVERSVNGGGFSNINSPAAGATTYTDSTTSAGNTYQYRVRAVLSSPAANSAYCTTATLNIQSGTFGIEGINFEGVNID